MPRAGAGPARHDFFGWVRDRAAACNGIVDATMSRDDGWRFLSVGRSLERADMTTRLLSARYGDAFGRTGWTTTLRTLLGLRGLPPHVQARGRRRRPRWSSCCSTGCSRGRCSTRSPPPSNASASSIRRSARAGVDDEARRHARSGLRRARVPAPRRRDGRPARRSSPASSTMRRGARARSRVATSARPGSSSGACDMSWRMRVRHTTHYHYEAPVHASYNEARISPLDTPSQFTLEHRVEVHPAANLFRYRDYWGSRVHAFDLHHEPHRAGDHRVRRWSRRRSARRASTRRSPGPRIDAPGLIDRFFEYLGDTRMTESDDAIRRGRRRPARRPPTPADALVEPRRVAARPRRRTSRAPRTCRRPRSRCCAPGAGCARTTCTSAIAVLRAAGIPARYASGYLYPDDSAA